MLLICDRTQLKGDYGIVTLGQYFECPDDVAKELIAAGSARRPTMPRILYETKVVTPEVKPLASPFVTCLCLTRNRRQWLPKAIACYRAQTYPHRELLIVADGESVRDLVPDDPSIRLLEIERAATIGEKRNLGCEHSRGDIIAHWDDDDYSAPDRLRDQLERLRNTGKSVTGYHSMQFVGDGKWQYRGTRGYALGTSLCYRRVWWSAHRFEPLQVGEDNSFVEEARKYQQLITEDAGDLMYATIHPGNTSPRNLKTDSWKRCG